MTTLLQRTRGFADPLLDLLSDADPLGLKRRTHRLGADDGAIGKVQDTLAWALNAVNVPGTQAWDDMSTDARVDWWVHRVGALNTVAVAYPGVLGALGDRLPLQDFLGFTSQAIVLCAVAREHGVDEPEQQVGLLAAVLCDRDLAAGSETAATAPVEPAANGGDAKGIWRLAGRMRGITGELAKRPHPNRFFRYLGMLPAIGAIADYLGEYGALRRTAKAGQRWISHHPG